MLTTRPVGLADLPVIAGLFDAYRQFYKQDADLGAAEAFIAERLRVQDTHLICAQIDTHVVGFTHLFPSFSSSAIARVFILNDLFVSPQARGAGAGRALLAAAKNYAISQGAISLYLSTQPENTVARALYEGDGWEHSTGFMPYHFSLSKPDRGS